MRTTSGSSPRGGMKSITRDRARLGLEVGLEHERVARGSGASTRRTSPSGASSQRPCSRSPSRAAKQAPESKRGKQSQSIEPSRPTSAHSVAGWNELAARLELPTTEPRAYALFADCFTYSKDSRAAAYSSRSLAACGIAVLRFDFIGIGESGGDFASRAGLTPTLVTGAAGFCRMTCDPHATTSA